MNRIKNWKNFNIINEENKFRNLFLSTLLSLGINFMDAQEIQKDSLKMNVLKNIVNFNKQKILNLDNDFILRKNLKDNLSKTIEDPETFIDKYLRFENDGTILVKSNFIEGLELYLNKNKFGLKFDF